jgi:hypothetical protein
MELYRRLLPPILPHHSIASRSQDIRPCWRMYARCLTARTNKATRRRREWTPRSCCAAPPSAAAISLVNKPAMQWRPCRSEKHFSSSWHEGRISGFTCLAEASGTDRRRLHPSVRNGAHCARGSSGHADELLQRWRHRQSQVNDHGRGPDRTTRRQSQRSGCQKAARDRRRDAARFAARLTDRRPTVWHPRAWPSRCRPRFPQS